MCSFCQSEAAVLAQGPRVSICDACVTKATAPAVHARVEDICSFCNKPGSIVLLGAANDARICSECIVIAHGVVDHERTKTAGTAR